MNWQEILLLPFMILGFVLFGLPIMLWQNRKRCPNWDDDLFPCGKWALNKPCGMWTARNSCLHTRNYRKLLR